MKYENKNNHNQKKLFTLIDEHYCDRQWHTFPRFLERAKMTEAARLKKFPIKHWRRQPGIRWPLGPMITDSWMFWLYPKITQRTHTQTQSVRDESHRQNVKEKKRKQRKKRKKNQFLLERTISVGGTFFGHLGQPELRASFTNKFAWQNGYSIRLNKRCAHFIWMLQFKSLSLRFVNMCLRCVIFGYFCFSISNSIVDLENNSICVQIFKFLWFVYKCRVGRLSHIRVCLNDTNMNIYIFGLDNNRYGTTHLFELNYFNQLRACLFAMKCIPNWCASVEPFHPPFDIINRWWTIQRSTTIHKMKAMNVIRVNMLTVLPSWPCGPVFRQLAAAACCSKWMHSSMRVKPFQRYLLNSDNRTRSDFSRSNELRRRSNSCDVKNWPNTRKRSRKSRCSRDCRRLRFIWLPRKKFEISWKSRTIRFRRVRSRNRRV